MDFQSRVAMVTGGSGALGSAVALDLAENGARVAVPYTADEHWAASRIALAPRGSDCGALKPI